MMAALFAFTSLSAYAQGPAKHQRFFIPFDFNVGKKVLPAGQYTVTAATTSVTVQSLDGRHTAVVLPLPTLVAAQGRTQVKLVFNYDGEDYHLSQIWLPDGVGRELKYKRTDRELARTNTETVEIAAN